MSKKQLSDAKMLRCSWSRCWIQHFRL